MAKFKVGDRVRILNVPSLTIYERHYAGCEHIVENVFSTPLKPIVYKLILNPYFYKDDELELVEPKVETPYKKPLIFSPFSKHDIYVNGKVETYGVETIEQPCNMPHEPKRLKVTFIEHTEKLPSQEFPKEEQKQDNPFKLDPHEFGRVALEFIEKAIDKPARTDDYLDAIEYGITPELAKRLDSIRTPIKPQPPKNRIPDRVVYDQSKGKVTVLMSKMNDGVAPYRAYTSKVNVESGDKYDGQFGFLLSYYKYLTRMYDPKKQKELIERIFKLLPTKRYPYLLGAVETEVMKLSDVFMTYKDWEDLYLAITEPVLAVREDSCDCTWDYLEWKEMLRVHELETKREKQREVSKEIKKHQKEIDRLKREG